MYRNIHFFESSGMNFLDPFFLEAIAAKVNNTSHEEHSWKQHLLPDHRKADKVKNFYTKGEYSHKYHQAEIEQSTPVDPQGRLLNWDTVYGKINHKSLIPHTYTLTKTAKHHIAKGHQEVSMNDVAAALARPDKVTSGYAKGGKEGTGPRQYRTYFYKQVGTYPGGKPYHIKVATTPHWHGKNHKNIDHKALTAHPVSSTYNRKERPVDHAEMKNAATNHHGYRVPREHGSK